MKKPVFTGAGVAIITPMHADGSVNYAELGRIIDDQIEHGIDAIIICGTTGESATLTHEEHAECIRFAVEHTARRVPVVAGTGSNDTAYAVKLSQHAEEVGADRIANAVAAEKLYGAPSIVVDFGTATNIDVVDSDGYYIGGAIAPGLRISMDALVARAARIASIPLETPPHAIGRTTEEAVQSGAVLGTAAMVEGLVSRIRAELGAPEARVIATGGLANIVADSTNVFDVVDGQLTLKGICEIARRMRDRVPRTA